jgi:hypothetical protein
MNTTPDLERQIREWTEKVADNYCKDCTYSCCDGAKHIIEFQGSDLGPFVEMGIPIIRESDLGATALEDFHLRRLRDQPYWTKDGKVIPKPALIERGLKKVSYVLYIEKFCPAYREGKGCQIHDDPRRPAVCKDYPVGIEGEAVWIKESCELFNSPEVRESFEQAFPSLKLCRDKAEFKEEIDKQHRIR